MSVSSEGRKTPSSTGKRAPGLVRLKPCKVSFNSREGSAKKENREPKNKEEKTMTEMVRVRTASIKLEAERRKLIAEKIRLKKQTGDVTDDGESQNEASVPQEKILSPIPSSRLATNRTETESSCEDTQNEAEKAKTRQQLENEYEDWKNKRQDAAVAIQSVWRGYSVRKAETPPEERIKEDFSHLHDQGLVIINIGRSKSEIERANRRYENASMIQMIYRACEIRRKLVVKAAKRRHEKNKAASKIQGLYKGYLTRYKLRESVSATRIQSVFKAYLARDNMIERERVKEDQRQQAASLLQAVYLSFRKRRQNEAEKKERRLYKAAEDVQSAAKGFEARLKYTKLRLERQALAADRIQSVIRGYKYRVKIREWRKAVNVIESGFKSYKARQEVQALKEKLLRERLAASKLQAAYRAHILRTNNRDFKDKMARQYRAASRIQCAILGRKARMKYKQDKEELKRRQQNAALKIQSVYRGHQGRKIARQERHVKEIHYIAESMINLVLNRTMNYVSHRTESSERIQATVKGYCTRENMAIKLSDDAKMRKISASAIQAGFRALSERKRQERVKEAERQKFNRHNIATIIQAVVRAKQVRVAQERKKLDELYHVSAVKIQALYRGYRTRSEIKKEKEMIAELEPPPSAMISARTRSGKLLSISVDEVLMKNSRAIILFHKKATELQDAFRGYMTRKQMMNRLDLKASVSQKTPRRVLSVTKRLTEEDKAAILIQKTFRRYWNQKVYQNALSKKKKLTMVAATNIQAAVKGYRVRVEESVWRMKLGKEGKSEMWRQKQQAADIISFAFRSYKHRNAKKALRVEM